MTGPVVTMEREVGADIPGKTGQFTERGAPGARPKLFLLNWIANPDMPWKFVQVNKMKKLGVKMGTLANLVKNFQLQLILCWSAAKKVFTKWNIQRFTNHHGLVGESDVHKDTLISASESGRNLKPLCTSGGKNDLRGCHVVGSSRQREQIHGSGGSWSRGSAASQLQRGTVRRRLEKADTC